jgi:hypothetical protein
VIDDTAQYVFSSAMMALFLLLFVRSGWNAIRGALGRRVDPSDLGRPKFRAFEVILTILYEILTPTITILTSLVTLGVIIITMLSLSLATALEFYIVYVTLQLPFVLVQIAIGRESTEALVEVFVDVFWPAHKRTLACLSQIAAAMRTPLVSA